MRTLPARQVIAAASGFAVLTWAPPEALAQVTGYESYHSAVWWQTTDTPSFTLADAQYFYAARVWLTSDTDATTGSVTVTGTAGSIPLSLLTGAPPLLFGSTGYLSQSDFDDAYPAGAEHVFAIEGGTLGPQSGIITHDNPLPYPNEIPFFVNFATFGALDRNAATFAWNGWTPSGSGPSATFLTVWDASNNLVLQEFLDPSGTPSYTVDPALLTPGSTYRAEVIFSSRVADGLGFWEGSEPPAGFAGYDFRTSADFTVVPEPRQGMLLAGVGLGVVLLWRRGGRERPGKR